MKRQTKTLSRKQRRKQERRFKKEKKHAYFSRSKKHNEVKAEEPVEVKTVPVIKVKKQKEKRKKQDLDPVNIRKKQLLAANKLEDKNIKQLEKKLKLNRRKSKKTPQSFVADGLDFILDVCDPEKVRGLTEDLGIDELDGDIGSPTEENFKKDTLLPADVSEENVDSGDSDSDIEISEENKSDSEHEDEECSDNELKALKNRGRKRKKQALDKPNVKRVHWQLDKKESSDEVDSDEENDDEDEVSEKEIKSSTWEDIYGRTRDNRGKVVKASSAYVPPAKRENTSLNEQVQRLKKQLKGLINRLSDANIQPICSQIEELYMSHSRNDMNETITALLMEALVQPILTPERLVQEHALLVALLHANIGSEIGAHILQYAVEKFHTYHKNQSTDGKEIHNILMLICYLYSFKVFNCVLIFDIMKLLTKNFTDLDVELLLLILKGIGFQLRRDDPIALKESILSLQTKADQEANHEQPRVRFMLETLIAIRNNNMHKIPNYDPSHLEHLKKLLRGIIRKGNSISELRISLDDFLNVEKKGRWWLVGSAWANDDIAKLASDASGTKLRLNISDEANVKILDKARRQRMNTDIRRSIFCVIMTAQDYLDCFEKLLHLGLKNQQEREIVVVILDCCINELSFNPFYAYLAQKFCSLNRRFQMAFQFALWDHFKELNSFKQTQITNLGKFVSHLLLSQSLSLSVLKVLYFSEMDKTLVALLRQIFLGLLLATDDEKIVGVFARIRSSVKLHLLRESLRLFLHHFMLKQQKLPEETRKQLEIRIKIVDPLLMPQV